MAPWRKVLYLRQTFPDSYVPRSFLRNTLKNQGYESPNLADLLESVLPVYLEYQLVVLFFCAYYQLLLNDRSANNVVLLASALLGLGAIVFAVKGWNKLSLEGCFAYLKSFAITLLLLVGMTPVFKTLTREISTDTIYFWSFALFATHLFSTPYRKRSTSALSLNAAVLSSVLLASRLEKGEKVTALMITSLAKFVVFPNLASSLMINKYSQLVASVFLTALNYGILNPLNPVLHAVFQGASLLVLFLFPTTFLFLVPYKAVMTGPWTEASVPNNLDTSIEHLERHTTCK